MKKILYLFIVCLLVANLYGQDSTDVYQAPVQQKTEKSNVKDKIYYGGNIGLSFGSYTQIGIYPLIGYKVTPKLSAGVKITYQYIKDNRFNSTYTTSNYGGSVFARFRIIPQLYLHSEYEMMNYKLYNSVGEYDRTWVPFLYVGAGYSQRLGSNTWLNVQVLFDVLQNANSPYNRWEPFYSVGVGVGF